MAMSAPDLSAELPTSLSTAWELITQFVALGGRHVVLSPGSRSAPLAYVAAVAHEAGLLTLHVRIDERSAAFVALGMAKANPSRPVIVAMTSGTAVANAHPAVLEADHSGLPLIVVSADRPFELRGTGANQTTTQPGMFGCAVRWSTDIPAFAGVDGMTPADAQATRNAVNRAVAYSVGSVGGPRGPVHINVAFRDPLAPSSEQREELVRRAQRVRANGLDGGTVFVSSYPPNDASSTAGQTRNTDVTHDVIDGLRTTTRTVILAGDTAPTQIIDIAEQYGWPILAEPSSGVNGAAPTIAGGALILARAGHPISSVYRTLVEQVEHVIVVGHPTLSRDAIALMRRAPQLTIAPDHRVQWTDPTGTATAVIPFSVLDPHLRSATAVSTDATWLSRWQQAGSDLLTQLSEQLDTQEQFSAPGHLAPYQYVRALVASVTPQHILMVGASSVIRDIDRVAPVPACVQVYANRGLAGIDGTVSTAQGIALTSPDRHTVLVVGDLTFLHDINGLVIGPEEPPVSLTIVVLNDNGGAIFGGLEHARSGDPALLERVFATPHGARIDDLARGYGATYQRVNTPENLGGMLTVKPAGIHVVEVVTSREERGNLDALLSQ